MNAPLNDSTGRSTRHLRIALVILDGFDFASLSAVLETISTARRRLGSDAVSCTTLGMSPTSMSSLGISVTPDVKLSDAPLSEYDITLLVGGSGANLKTDSELSQQLISAHKASRLLGGVWNGAYHLAAAGLTEGYECLIRGDGRFSIEPPTAKRRRQASWQFDESRMTCSDAHGATCMMHACFEHFYPVSVTGKLTKKNARRQRTSESDSFPEAC